MSTAMPPPPPKRPSPPGKPPGSQVEAPRRSFGVSRVKKDIAHKIVIYGPGGVGKSELASLIALCDVRVLFIDLEDGTKYLDVDRVQPTVERWEELRSILQDPATLQDFDAVALDSMTRAEELALPWTLENVKHEKGHTVTGIEGYGFGKGLTHVYETFLQLLCDLDGVARRGKHVICLAHECVSVAPNPAGEDWIRYEPRLQMPTSGKSSIRHRVKEWCDHLLFVGYDTFVKEGSNKAQGAGTRTIYPTEMPTHLAKSRSLSDPIPYEKGNPELWKQLLGKGK